MAAAKPTEQLHAELECPVCQDWYTDPVDLSCGHNFCRPCLLAAFRARPDDSGEFHDFLDCPVCRKRTYTNTQKIGKMPVNLKLRNIITAIQAKENVKPTECEVHHKPHVMFCHDCKDVKCLTCFTKACKLHNTEEIDDIGSQLRSVLNSKRAEIDQRIENLNKLKEKVKSSTVQDAVENELVFLLEQVESLNVDLIDEKCLEFEKYSKELRSMENTSNASLVQNKSAIDKLSIDESTSSKLNTAQQIYDDISSDLQKMNEKLKNILKANGRSTHKKPVPKPRARTRHPQDSHLYSNGSTTTEVSQTDYEDFDAEFRAWQQNIHTSSLDPDIEETLSSALQAASLRERHDGDTPNEISPGRPPNGLLTAQMFLHENFSSVSYMPHTDSFYANTNVGCQRIITLNSHDNGDNEIPGIFLEEVAVSDMCAIPSGKVLVLAGQELGIYRSPGSEPARLYSMPNPANNRSTDGLHRVSCIVRDNGYNYAVTDLSGHVCIWNPSYRNWEEEICVYAQAGYDRKPASFVFNMCVTFRGDEYTNTILYFALYYQGEILAYDDETKQVLWHNHFACHHPAGIASTPDKLLVCEALESCPSVVVMGHDGVLLQKIMQNYFEGPCWGIVSSSESPVQIPHAREVEGNDTTTTVAVWHQSSNRDMFVDVFHLNPLLASG